MSKRLELFDKMIAKGTSDPFHYYARAMELRSLGRRDDAFDAFVELTARFPEYVPSYLMAAQLGLERGEPSRALALARDGVAAAERAGDEHARGELQALIATVPA